MLIAKDSAVTIHFQLRNTQGKVLEKSQQPLAYLHGGYGNIFPKIEAALQGKSAGYQVTVDLSPEDAFGAIDPALQQVIPKTQFPPGVKVGGQLEGRDAQGNTRAFTVVKIKGAEVHLDGNHPLAGQHLRFSCEVVEVRDASEEEIAHGHVHGVHGHQH